MNNHTPELPLYDPVSGTGQVAFPPDQEQMEQCEYCEQLIDINNMDDHIRGVHGRFYNGRIKVPCALCGKQIRKVGMKSHLKDKHGIRG